MASTQFFFFAILAILAPSILAKEIKVGDDKGWTINFDYQAWAKGKEFVVGEKLVFIYPQGDHNVIKVDGSGFQQYVASANTETLTTENDVINLTSTRNKWYICGVSKHCESGNQKLAITVAAESSSSPPLAVMGSVTLLAILSIIMMMMI
ncbi:blue copper protein-like [Carya illinoinensis]|uniref:Phytocyanin domain-containing protein n=1 Tax=Carya illinoinensis TaxID=32201 RepID=A0A8T1P4P3_CARIL|nr:blue copper protein-like [Carya illinoinensis]KAG6636811.1 hypothetical protein CIPAW_11G136500 [Carya illinoinensis]